MPNTPNLNIPHIASSQSNKTVTANTAFDDLDTAMTDYFAINCAGSADVTPGSAVLLEFFLDLTGVLTGNIHLILPAAKKLYYVRNSATGSAGSPPAPCTITARTTASGSPPPNAVALNEGDSGFLYSDGTNIVKCSPILNGGLDIAATQAPVAPPTTTTSPGIAGQWAYDATYVYHCVAANTWGRDALDFAF
jgi:hypothetical protein